MATSRATRVKVFVLVFFIIQFSSCCRSALFVGYGANLPVKYTGSFVEYSLKYTGCFVRELPGIAL